MARQSGHLLLTGRLGDLSFYHDRLWGYLVRRKGGPSKESMKSSPKFERSRENAYEFSHAARTGKLIRHAARMLTGLKGDSTVTARLNSVLVKLGKQDTTIRGQRKPEGVLGDHSLAVQLSEFRFYLTGFNSGLSGRNWSLDVNGGFVTTHQPLLPESVSWPSHATHLRIRGGIAVLNFPGHSFEVVPAADVLLERNFSPQQITLVTDPVFAGFPLGVVSVTYLQYLNGESYVLSEGTEVWLVV